MSELRKSLQNEVLRRTEVKFREAIGNPVAKGVMINASVPGGSRLGDWGALIGSLISQAGAVYGQKELAKQQAELANKLAEAEAKKMLAETQLQLAQAKNLQEAAALQERQNELQKILRDIQFTGVQKWLLGAAGFLTIALIGMIAYRKMAKPRRRRSRR